MMQTKNIRVIADDRIVIVEGVAHRCLTAAPPDLHAVRWTPNPDQPELQGYVEKKEGNSHHFADFAIIKPFVEAWEKADLKAKQATKSAQDAATEARRAAEVANAKAAADHQEHLRKEEEARAEYAAKLAMAEVARVQEETAKVVAENRARAEAAALQKPVNDAHTTLINSDHKLLKILEAKYGHELDPELLAQRRAARAFLRAEKAKSSN